MGDLAAATELEDLLRAVAAGDRVAFGRLYDLAAPHLFPIALRILRRRDRAEEILQDAFVSIWRRAGDWSPERGSARTWLSSIVHHRAIDAIRREGRLVQLDEEAHGEMPDDAPDAFDLASAGEDAKRLAACLEGLEAQPRRAIRLAYWRGLSHEELAVELGAPMGTVKSWIRRGLQRLKTCLEGARSDD